MNRVLFINTIHNSFDDRTFYHHAVTLSKHGADVSVFSTLESKSERINDIQICSDKFSHYSALKQIKFIAAKCAEVGPHTIVCDSPIGVLAAFFSKKKCEIIYDVTEWIPSKKNFKNANLMLILPKWIGLFAINFLAGLLTNKFIFGEYYKSKPFDIFFWKKKIISSYFPDLTYIPKSQPRDITSVTRLNYSGWFSVEKGFDKVLSVVRSVANLLPDNKFVLQLIGDYKNEADKNIFEAEITELPTNVLINRSSFKSFEDFCHELSDADLFFDLRVNDFENTHCLPIKLFYYIACGKPVIFSNLKAIKRELDINTIGCTFENNEVSEIAKKIEDYIKNPALYKLHCKTAANLSQTKYNWGNIMPEFVQFVLPISKNYNL